MKRTLSLVLALVMVLGTFSSVFAAPAEKSAIEILHELGVVAGDAAGLRPGDALKREEAVVMVSRLKGAEEEAKNFPMAPTFKDITNKAYVPFIAWAQADGTIEGHNKDKFGFGEDLTAKQYAVVLLKVLGYEVDWATVEKVAGEVLEGVNLEAKLTRGSMAEMTLVALNTKVNGEEVTLAEKLNIELPKEEPTLPAKLEVVNVKADNYKQVIVEFNTAVDEDSAVKLDNYAITGKTFEEAVLLEDGKTVVVTLKDDGITTMFDKQKEYEITINNVLNADKTLKLEKVKVKFVPIDVTLPTVKDVEALGTKAIKVVFSEPVQVSPANSTVSYKIDGKAISGSVKYVFPNEVIISTTVAVGEHKLSVSGVKDFAGYAVQETGFAFTVVEDTVAPEIVSAKSVDLKKVIVEFNEPVKAVASGYHTSKANMATTPISISGNKVTLSFTNSMSLANTTIFVNGVEDYSGNKADRTTVITPELDTTRPEVTEVKVTDAVKFEVTFNKEVTSVDANGALAGARLGTNYIIKNSEGKVPAGYGLNTSGNPVVSISYNSTDKKATFTLVKALPKGSYTLEVLGIQDTSYIKNTMLPYTYSFEVGDLGLPTVTKAWYEKANIADGKEDGYVYVQFSEAMATEGNGNVLDVIKYNYTTTSADVYGAWRPMPTGTTIDLVAADTVRLNLPRAAALGITGVRVTLVADLAENFIADLVGYKAVGVQGTIGIKEVVATAVDTIKATFLGKLANVDSSDFTLNGNKSLILDSFSYNSSGNTVAIFKLAKADEVNEDVYNNVYTFKTATLADDIASQDAFGAKVTNNVSVTVGDEINPTLDKIKIAGDVITVKFNEKVNVTNIKSVVSVKVNGTAKTVNSIAQDANGNLVINVTLGTVAATDIVEVNLLEANGTVEAVVDHAGNAATSFQKYVVYQEATAVVLP